MPAVKRRIRQRKRFTAGGQNDGTGLQAQPLFLFQIRRNATSTSTRSAPASLAVP